MEQNLEELLTKTTKNFKLAEEQYLESSEETDLSLRKLRKMNYDNATNILNLVEDMAGKNKTVQKQNPNIKERTSKAGRIVLNTQQPSDNGTNLGNDDHDHNTNNGEIKLQFPSYDEIQKDAQDDPKITISTSNILREAAKQTFVGGGSKKSTKKENNHSKNESGMTREEYRKRHNK